MIILGLSGLYHDSAAAIVIDGKIVAAAQEERFTRKKHDPRFPTHAALYCIKQAEIEADDIDYIAFYDNPLLTLDRYIKNIIALGTDSRDLISTGFDCFFSERIWIHKLAKKEIGLSPNAKTKFIVTKHHISHAASAFFPSPYDRSVIITLDGVGEWTTLSIGVGKGNHIELKEEIKYPHSIGLFYSAFTYFCGFKVNSGDYKFMGLAPYGKPKYYDTIINNIIDIKKDGSFALNLEYFDYQNGRTMINETKMAELFMGRGRRKPESVITQREMDIAASVQLVTEEIILRIARHAKKVYGQDTDSLVLAGGVALNCVANGRLLRSGIFSHIWIQPAAGDAGGALGAALYVYYDMLDHVRSTDGIHDKQDGSYLGPQYCREEIKEFCNRNSYVYHEMSDAAEQVAELLQEEKVIGLFYGRMEYGPRALGHRSIIADPRSETMQSRLNLKIKYRESFRPFAPAVLKEDLQSFFEMTSDSPYMLLCADVIKERRIDFELQECLNQSRGDMLPVVNVKRSDVPAVTHVDYSARIQTVDGIYNRKFYEVMRAFKKKTGCPVVINTSFNVRGEPIVCSPEDAYRCFMRTEMDVLIMEDILLYKEEQPIFDEKDDWRNEYELD